MLFIVCQVGTRKVRPPSEIHHPHVPKSLGIQGLDELKIAYLVMKEQKGEDGVPT